MKRTLAAALLLCLAIGCAKTRTYDVSVRNDTDRPVTVWLIKDGPPSERAWKSPEDLAIESPKATEYDRGVVIAPGKSASTSQIGKFMPKTNALIRVYRGEPTYTELLAIDRGSPDRSDVMLRPGDNRLVVKEVDEALKVEPVGMGAE